MILSHFALLRGFFSFVVYTSLQVLILGLSLVLPLLDASHLNYPKLARHLFRLLEHVADVATQQLLQAPTHVLHQLLSLMDAGVFLRDLETSGLALNSIVRVSEWRLEAGSAEQSAGEFVCR